MAFDCFLKIGTIPGESSDDKYKDHIEVLSYSHGLTQSHNGAVSNVGGQTAGRVDHQDFSVVKVLDKASPKLALACCNGEHIKEVTLLLCRAGKDKQKYMEYKMSDAVVQSIRPGGTSSGNESRPLEEVAFTYGKIEWTYTEIDHATGSKKGDIKASLGPPR